VYLKI